MIISLGITGQVRVEGIEGREIGDFVSVCGGNPYSLMSFKWLVGSR